MKNNHKTLIYATLIAPFASIIVIGFWHLAAYLFDDYSLIESSAGYGFAYAPFIVGFALLGCIIFGLPVHFVLKNYQLNKLRHYILTGFIPIFVLVFVSAFIDFGELDDSFVFACSAGISGMTTAILFWLILKIRKYDFHDYERFIV